MEFPLLVHQSKMLKYVTALALATVTTVPLFDVISSLHVVIAMPLLNVDGVATLTHVWRLELV